MCDDPDARITLTLPNGLRTGVALCACTKCLNFFMVPAPIDSGENCLNPIYCCWCATKFNQQKVVVDSDGVSKSFAEFLETQKFLSTIPEP